MKKINLINSANNEKDSINCKLCCNFVTIKKLFAIKSKIDPRIIQILNNEKDTIVDHNKLVPPDQNTFLYEIDNEKYRKDLILNINENYFGIPEFIEINGNSSIHELKGILLQYSNEPSNIFVFDENGNLLDKDKTVFSCNIIDDCKLSVWRGDNLLVTVNTILPFLNRNSNEKSNESFSMTFSVTEKISDIKNRISENPNLCNISDSALFTDSYYLRKDKYLVDYPFQNKGTDLYFVDLKNNEGISKGPRITKGKYYSIFKGEFGAGICAEPVALCQYSLENQDIEDKKILKYEIISRLLLCNNSNSRFVELISMFEKHKFFYIVTPYLEKGSVRTLYKVSSLEENKIIHYSTQICEALQFMHHKQLIHRTLTCSSALVDANDNIKLTNFHLSKYLHNYSTAEILQGIPGSKIDTKKCWLAPEVLREEIYGLKADMWSFGATMIEMVTRIRPYPGMNVLLAIRQITIRNEIEYDKTIFPQLNTVIDECLKSLPKDRPTSDKCLHLLRGLNINN